MTRLLPALFLAACAVDPASDTALEADALPVDQAPPAGAGGLTLAVDGILEPGTTITFTVSGAAANAQVQVLRGSARQAGALCPAPLGGLCVDISNPQILATIRANAQGRATLTATVPNLPNGTRAYFQAATTTVAATSDVVAKYNPLSTSAAPTGQGATTLLRQESATVTQAGGYRGTRTDIWDSAVAGMESCVYQGSVTGSTRGALPACNGCEFAYQVTVGPFTEVPSTGDCLDILSINLPATPAFTSGIAFEATYNLPPYGLIPVAMGFDTTTNAWTAMAPATFNAQNGAFAWEAPGANTYAY
jgi:hypothetical protein